MLLKLKQHITLQFPFLEGKKILIAVSGGLDSVVLTELFHSLNYNTSLAHCNFNLRALESDKDEAFVKNLGDRLQLKTYTTKFDTNKYASINKISTQIAARELRYQWFQELTIEHQFDYVLTAHHADDNLETFLINLSRGTGLEGFTGIPPINKNIVRPLLIFSREDIEEYASTNKIAWREDESNATTKYIRNKIRHQVVPVLKEINPTLLNSFQKTTDNLKGSQQIINDALSEVKKKVLITEKNEVLKFDVSEILSLSNPKAYLFELLKPYHFTAWNDVTNLLTSQSGKQVFSKTHRLLKDRDVLLLSKRTQNKEPLTYTIQKNTKEITMPVSLRFEITNPINNKDNAAIYLDLDSVSFPLTIRKWKEGDSFFPTGMEGRKKLSKFFKDEKYSLIDKENTWLLCSDDQITWIIDKRQDRRFSASKNTISALKINLTN
jgi:tRNA(Ile)-lysidine synthase